MQVEEKYSYQDMIEFGNFIRDNFYGVGAPRLMSYDVSKYPHSNIEEIYLIWAIEKQQNAS